MPTIWIEGPYRFFFYAGDRNEPVHIHVERDDATAKFWLEPVRLQRSNGFRMVEVRRIRKIVEEHQAHIMECWHEYFAD